MQLIKYIMQNKFHNLQGRVFVALSCMLYMQFFSQKLSSTLITHVIPNQFPSSN